jgi:hypothetical protein
MPPPLPSIGHGEQVRRLWSYFFESSFDDDLEAYALQDHLGAEPVALITTTEDHIKMHSDSD